MAFTAEEQIVLSQLAYCSQYIHRGQSLRSVLEDNNIKEALKKNLGKNYNEVINGLKEKVSRGNYTIVKSETKQSTGFGAIAIKDPNNNVTIAARGTDGFSFDSDSRKDVLTGDLPLACGTGDSIQHKEMEAFINDLEKEDYNGYYFTGHSLGGNLAMYGAIYLAKKGKQDKVLGVTAFNAPQFNDTFMKINGKYIDKIQKKITQYQNENDIVSSINGQNTIGKVKICKTLDKNGNPLDFKDHSMKYMNVNELTNKKNPAMDTLVKIFSSAVSSSPPLQMVLITLAVLASAIGFIKDVFSAVGDFIMRALFGGGAGSPNPNIHIDTTRMRNYSNQLSKVSKRAKVLDRRMNSLYWHLGIEWDTIFNLAKLLRAGIVLDYAGRLDRCVNYLNNTANDFESAERELSNI